MYLNFETIRGFRNLKECEFAPVNAVNVIYGENGQGKTNLLESIFLLTGAKSFRKVKDAELICKDGEGFSAINADIFAEQRDQNINLTITEGKGRMMSYNKCTPRRASDFAGGFCCVVFSPEHLDLVKGSPADRRRFLDTAICQLYPTYIQLVRQYNKILDQRNALLKQARSVAAAFDMLEVYDRQLAVTATTIAKARRLVIDKLSVIAAEAYADVSSGKEQLKLRYVNGAVGMYSQEDFYNILCIKRNGDFKLGYTSFGPHRDDIYISLDGQDAKTFASQGQQRTAVLALKLAEAGVFRDKMGEDPVLLLDDVLSELDASRQEYLLKRLGRSQAIITCCEPEFISRKTDCAIYEMKSGVLSAKK